MEALSRSLVQQLQLTAIDPPVSTNLPEKVLQFGAGVLLRALPDYFIEQANRKGLFMGRVLVVKSTAAGNAETFSAQDNLYTICIRGRDGKGEVYENLISSAISRVLDAESSWSEVLQAAHHAEMKIIISNTTEAGICYVSESVHGGVPKSFPAKLLAFLFERFKAFGGTIDSGMVILPTELIPDNGAVLKSVLLRLADENKLGDLFSGWLSYHNTFCNTLVDRIVPGRPTGAMLQSLETELGYTDALLCMAEPYCLWAIEGGKEVAGLLGFHEADPRMIISTNIEVYRELKLRLLNGTHTLSCGLAVLAGLETVEQAMSSPQTSVFIRHLLLDELAVSMPYKADPAMVNIFAGQVLDRFSNKSIDHLWIRICAGYTEKLKIRVLPVLKEFYKLNNQVPRHIALGFAGYIRFMQSTQEEGIYKGRFNNQEYHLEDAHAALLNRIWADHAMGGVVTAVLGSLVLWGTDLNLLPGFGQAVAYFLNVIETEGIEQAFKKLEK